MTQDLIEAIEKELCVLIKTLPDIRERFGVGEEKRQLSRVKLMAESLAKTAEAMGG